MLHIIGINYLVKSSLEDTEIKEENILLNIKTAFVPPHNSMLESSEEEPIISHAREVRDIEIADIHLKNESDVSSFR